MPQSLPTSPRLPPRLNRQSRSSTAPPRRHNHVAVFISRKDKKLYIRHGYEPVFDTPVEIADADRPLGTHVFTARGDKDDTHALHWSVVSLPVSGTQIRAQAHVAARNQEPHRLRCSRA